MNAPMPRFVGRSIDTNFLPLIAVLCQLRDLLDSVDDHQYSQKPVGPVSGSLGAHVRHSLDHVEALIASLQSGSLDYDRRNRGTLVESSRSAGLEKTCRLIDSLSRISEFDPTCLVFVRVVPDPDSNAIFLESTLGREIAFVVNHSIHHNALIGVIANVLCIPVPDRFGYAPSTIQYLERLRCAQ